MKHHEAIAVAKDLKERVKKHLDKGEALLKLQPSLEQYKEVIQFNAIADDILRTYAANKVSVEDFDDTALTDRIASMESLLSDIVKFVRGKKKTEAKQTPAERQAYEPMIKKFQWLATTATELIDKYEPKEGTFKLNGHDGPFFQGDLKRLHKDFKADIDVYNAVFKRVESGLKPAIAHMRAFTKGLDRFIGDAERADEFLAYVSSMVKKEPKPFKDTFTPPSHNFLAIGKPDEWFALVKGMPEFPYEKKEVELPYPTKEELIEFHGLAVRLAASALHTEQFIDELPLGLDYSDPPFRGYAGHTEIDAVMMKSTFLEPVFGEQHTGVAEKLDNAIGNMAYAAISYIRKALA